MQKFTTKLLLAVSTVLAVAPALASQSTHEVPEIDGGAAALALALTIGIVALVREHRRK